MLATNIAGLRSRLVLAQHPNDPLFREPRLLHLRLPQGDGFYPFLEELAGLRSRWMNQATDERGSAGIRIVWPDISNAHFKEALADGEEGLGYNNMSAV